MAEKYSPCETTLEVTTPEGLNDTSLASSFPLHTATPSASSNRLDEINEDEDEEDSPSLRTSTSQATSNGSYFGSQRHRKERRLENSPPPAIHIRSDSSENVPASSPPIKAHVAQYVIQEGSGPQSMSSLIAPTAPTTQYANVLDSNDAQSSGAGSETPRAATTPTSPLFKPLPSVPTEDASAPRIPDKSSERFSRTAEVRQPKTLQDRQPVERPTTSATISTMTSSIAERSKYDDPYDFSRFDIKPKQKLGPRPVASGEKTKRPTVASISSMPATYRPTMKKPELSRPTSHMPVSSGMAVAGAPKSIPAPPPIPDVPEYKPRPLSRGSIKSLPSHKSTAMTPDKIRLMKAVELRKKQLRKSNPQAGAFVPPPDDEAPAVPAVPEQAQIQEKAIEKPGEAAPPLVQHVAMNEQEVLANKADSGIEMVYDKSQGKDESTPSEFIPPKEEEESNEQSREPTPAEPELSGLPEPPSEPHPRVDTPRDIIGQFPEDNDIRPHIVDVPVKDEGSSDMPTPRAPGMPRSGTNFVPEEQPEIETDTLVSQEKLGSDAAPTLPMSRHALHVDPSERNQSIDESRASENDPAGVPTIIMGDGSRPLSALIREARSEDSSASESEVEENSVYESANSSSDLAPPEKNIRRKNSDIAKRRRGFVEPIQINDDIEFDSDEELMDELQSATLQEAKPITVARSPVAHYFPRRPSANSAVSDSDGNSTRPMTAGSRAPTMPGDFTDTHGRLSPDPSLDSPGHDRSISSVSTEKPDPMAAFKRNVSNGISRRIQALADRSSPESNSIDTPSLSRPTSPEVSANGFPVKDPRQQTRSPPPSGSRTSSFRAISRHSSRISAYQSIMGGSTPPATENNNTVWNVENHNQGGLGSVSVTARIMRPTSIENVTPPQDMEAEFRPSQLVVSSHKRGVQSSSSIPHLSELDTSQKPEETPAPSSVSPILMRGSTDGSKQLHSANRFSRHKQASSPTAEDFPVPPPSIKPQAIQPAPAVEENIAPKEGTKTSRFFKRMSNIGNKRRSMVAQSVASTESPTSERGSLFANNLPASKEKSDLPPALTVGDLNIQFPDSLVNNSKGAKIENQPLTIS